MGSLCTANRTSGGPLASGYTPMTSRTGCGCGANRDAIVESRTGCGCGANRNAIAGSRTGCGCGANRNAIAESRTGCGCGGNRNAVAESRTGCGCGNRDDNRQEPCACAGLLAKIRAVDFALYELVLYLEHSPDRHDALDMYHKLLCRKKELTAEYESTCGPLTAFGNESHTSWDWVDKPFPWEYSAN